MDIVKVFGSNMAFRENMEYDAELDEYTCQNGKKKIFTEAMGYNINKLHAKIEQKRLRTQLFEKLSA